MNTSNTSHNTPSTDWQMLGELELPVGSSTDYAIQAWLSEILAPLRLEMHFLNQILRSAQDTSRRAMGSERAVEFQHLHLLVHAPKQPAAIGQNWGFFQIEKTGDSMEGGNPHDHAIEFYLYLEG